MFVEDRTTASTSLAGADRCTVVSNNSQCQITRIRAIARARSREVSYAGVYLFLGLGLSLIIPTSRANLVLRVVWQCDIFGTNTGN